MTVVRVPLIVLISLMLDLLTPVAMGSTEAIDMFEEEAIHRPRCNSAIRLVRAVSRSRIGQPRTSAVRIRLQMRAPAPSFLTGPAILKAPQPNTRSASAIARSLKRTDTPAPSDDH